MRVRIRKVSRVRTVNIAVLHPPKVQSVHGRHCICHRCAR